VNLHNEFVTCSIFYKFIKFHRSYLISISYIILGSLTKQEYGVLNEEQEIKTWL
jgi:hypothetical protein